jgi:hypothetical protein
MEEPKFITGLFTKRSEKAPDFLLASLSFKTEQFIEWLKSHTNSSGYVNVDVLKSKDGGVYSKHNDWQPSGDREQFVKDGVTLKVEPRDEELEISQIPF